MIHLGVSYSVHDVTHIYYLVFTIEGCDRTLAKKIT
jgi:hypothetical protein